SGPLVEARELLEEFVQGCRDSPTLSFPLISLRDGDEVQQLAAPDQVTVDVPALSEGDCRFMQVPRQVGRIDQSAPGDESGEYRGRRIEEPLTDCRADAIGGYHQIGRFHAP